MNRPDPGYEAPEGVHFEARPAAHWRLVTGRRCRFGAGYKHPACGQPSVAELDRSWRGGFKDGRQIWAYCEQHLYNHWIEDGVVMEWAWIADEKAAVS
jgi:hypothetical protein